MPYQTFPAIGDEAGWTSHDNIVAAVAQADAVAATLPEGEFATVYLNGITQYRAGGFAGRCARSAFDAYWCIIHDADFGDGAQHCEHPR